MRGGRRSGLMVLGALGVVLVVSASLVVAAAARDDGPSAAIDGYPQRIRFERPSPRLPDRPGPLAATLYDNNFGLGRNLGVTSRGDLYELPAGTNLLSPDGRLLLTATGDPVDSRLAVHDLSTGDVRVFEDIAQAGPSSNSRPVRHRLDLRSAVHWSPDGTTLLARFTGTQLLDIASGVLTDVGGGAPAGFRNAGEAVTVSTVEEDKVTGLVVTTTEVKTGNASSRALQLDGPWLGDPGAALVASVSPEGTLLLVEAVEGDDTLRLFSLGDGTELPSRIITRTDRCSPTWLDGDPVFPTTTRGFRGSLSASSELVTADGSRPLVAVHHRMQSSCLQPTTDALRAGPHRALLGTSTWLWTWYWQPLLIIGSLGFLALGLVVRRLRRA